MTNQEKKIINMTITSDNTTRGGVVQCPNCLGIFYSEPKRGRKRKYCCDRCRKNYWNSTHKEYYQQYYQTNRERILEYYKTRKVKYNKMQRQYYEGKKEVRNYY